MSKWNAYVSNIPATKPTHFAYGVTVRSQSVAISRTIVVVTQIHPQKTQTRVICKESMGLCVECDGLSVRPIVWRLARDFCIQGWNWVRMGLQINTMCWPARRDAGLVWSKLMAVYAMWGKSAKNGFNGKNGWKLGFNRLWGISSNTGWTVTRVVQCDTSLHKGKIVVVINNDTYNDIIGQNFDNYEDSLRYSKSW